MQGLFNMGILNAKEFVFVKNNELIKVKDYEIERINQLIQQGFKIKE